MKTFIVSFSYTVQGYATHIEAESAEEAKQWLYDEMNQNGIDEFEYETTDRDYMVYDATDVHEKVEA